MSSEDAILVVIFYCGCSNRESVFFTCCTSYYIIPDGWMFNTVGRNPSWDWFNWCSDSEDSDYIRIMCECHRHECSKSIFRAAFLPRFFLGVWINLYSCLRNESVEVLEEVKSLRTQMCLLCCGVQGLHKQNQELEESLGEEKWWFSLARVFLIT